MPVILNDIPVALSVAGSDCSCGAGAQADLKTFSAHGVYGLTALTCVVAEVPGKVTRIEMVEPDMMAEQLRLLLDAFPVQAMKTGMVPTASHVEAICATWDEMLPKLIVIDSIQVMYLDSVESAPGGVAQVRESAALLIQQAKRTDTILLLVGHVTKEGHIAGPRVLEHMVDAVLYFESESDSRFRILRAVKNRFGAANELGIFAMTETGMREVKNPSAIFLSRHPEPVAGCVVTVSREGSRPLLIEVQALADQSGGGNVRRLAVGLDQNRLSMLLATLNRHAGVSAYDHDVFVNVVGGVRISETSADLAALIAAVSSLKDMPVSQSTVVFGEVGLAGEIRPVSFGEERLREAVKRGFDHAVIPRANMPKNPIKGIKLTGVDYLRGALDALGLE